MKRECLLNNYFNRFVVYSLCIIVTFISLLAFSSNALAQGYDSYYQNLEWDAFLPRMSYQYPSMNGYFDQDLVQTEPVNLGMATAQYTYSHMSGAGLQNTYAFNPYTNPGVSAAPARSRNMLFEFWMNTAGQSNYPGSGSGSGSNVWVPQSRGPGNPSPAPRPSFPVPDIWTYSMPNIWTGVTWTTMGANPSFSSPDLWSSQGYSLGAMSGISFLTPSLWSPQGGYSLGAMSGISF